MITGTPTELKRQVSGDAVHLSITRLDRVADAARVATSVPGATEVAHEGTNLSFRVADGGSELPNLLRMLDAQGIELTAVEVHRPSLDDVFLSLTGRSLHDTPTT